MSKVLSTGLGRDILGTELHASCNSGFGFILHMIQLHQALELFLKFLGTDRSKFQLIDFVSIANLKTMMLCSPAVSMRCQQWRNYWLLSRDEGQV